jgi:hypothetical protein
VQHGGIDEVCAMTSIDVVHSTAGYMDGLVKEAVEIQLNTRNLYRVGGFILSQAWYPVTNMLYNQKAGPGRVST